MWSESKSQLDLNYCSVRYTRQPAVTGDPDAWVMSSRWIRCPQHASVRGRIALRTGQDTDRPCPQILHGRRAALWPMRSYTRTGSRSRDVTAGWMPRVADGAIASIWCQDPARRSRSTCAGAGPCMHVPATLYTGRCVRNRGPCRRRAAN